MLVSPASSFAELPQYHDNLLMVKVRPSAASFATATAAGAGPAFSGAPGLAALAMLERAGLVKQVIRFDGGATPPALSAVAALASSAAPDGASPALAGANLVEVQSGADLQQVHLALANDPHVEAVTRVPVRYLLARRTSETTPPAAAAVPPPAGSLWNLQRIKWQQAVDQGLSLDTEVEIAVLDTGIDLGHPDLPRDNLVYVHDYLNDVSTSEEDIVGHGTHVAGTICAAVNNAIGINGVCRCHLSAYKIFGDDTFFTGRYFAYLVDPVLYRAALAAALEAGVQVVNLSIGGYGAPDALEKDLFQELIDNGTIVVAAMGNDNTSRRSYPAALPGVIAIGATNINDSKASFSNYGRHIALCAPGVGIWSTLPRSPGQTGFWPLTNPAGRVVPGQPMKRETDYDAWDGTSMATPHVAAAAALALARKGTMSAAAMKDLLMQTADKVPDMHGQAFTTRYGAGRLNLVKLL